jgi:hypothetical protein
MRVYVKLLDNGIVAVHFVKMGFGKEREHENFIQRLEVNMS